MSYRRPWELCMALVWGIATAGCQSGTPESSAMVPAFGVNAVPKQTEPELDYDDSERTVASRETEGADDESAKEESGGRRKGTLLSRLLPAKEKEPLERRPLPLSESTEADRDDDNWD